MSQEIFVEVTRNKMVESWHCGAAVVTDHRGNVLESWGDINKLMFPRSALKPFLAIDLVACGASDHFNLSAAELSLACSSHQGEARHQEGVEAWLARLGLTHDHLACGAALPGDPKNAQKLLASGQQGCRFHHNCSGKHAGFLTTALHLDLPVADYHLVDHPLQKLSLNSLSELVGVDVRHNPIGIDGCGFPAPMMTLRELGCAVARFAKPSALDGNRAAATSTLHRALSQEPLYAAGQGTVVTDLITITKGAVLPKTGAEGVLTAAIPDQGLGIALKICDGSARARSAALLAILDHLGILSDAEKDQLQTHRRPSITNSRGLVLGEIRPAASWLPR